MQLTTLMNSRVESYSRTRLVWYAQVYSVLQHWCFISMALFHHTLPLPLYGLFH